MLEKSRLQGVARGTPNGELILERVMSDEQVIAGETVLSSGGDQIFPKGLPLGTVSNVSPGKEMFLNIHVKPAADLSRVEEVLVVTEKQERAPVAESAGRVRAADILAQRLPSVPEKSATVAGTAPAGSAPKGATAQGPASQGPAAGEKPKPDAASKPLTANGTGTGIGTGSGTGTTVEVLKKVAQKPAAGGSGANSGSGSEAGSSATLSPASAGTNAPPKSASPAAKPATAQPKPASTQPGPRPPASPTPTPVPTEDNPH